MPGLFADRNELADTACSVTGPARDWLDSAPPAALRTASLVDAAVTKRLGTEGDPVTIDIIFPHHVESAVACLLDVNLDQWAFWRLQRFADPAMTELVDDSRRPLVGDRMVVPSLFDPADLPFLAPNQIAGQLDPRDWGLLPKHILVPLPSMPIRSLRWSLYGPAVEADGAAALGYKIGMAWTGAALPLDRHVGASGDGYRPGDTVTTGEGASLWVEPGIGRRVSAIDRLVTNKKTRMELFKTIIRVGLRKPLIWVPNISDWAENFFFGGIFRNSNDYDDKYTSPKNTSVTLNLQEYRE